MSKTIRTRKPSVLPFYAMALVFLVLCAVLPVYKLWALLVARPGWWSTRCLSTPVWRMWTRCWPTCKSSWTPCTR